MHGTYLSLENSADSYLCFQPALLHSVKPVDWSTHLLMCLSLETLMSIVRTGLLILVELIDLVNFYKFFISNDLTQMVNFPTQIPHCDSHSLAYLDLFLSSDAIICSTMAFPPLGQSDHVVVSFSIDFPSNSQQDALFHCIAHDYSCAD